MPNKDSSTKKRDKSSLSESERDLLRRQAESDEMSRRAGNPSPGLPIVVKTRGEIDPYETGRIRANNYENALDARRKENAEEKEMRRQEDITRASQAEGYRSQAYAKGGMVKKYAKGGMAGCGPKKYAKGGMVTKVKPPGGRGTKTCKVC